MKKLDLEQDIFALDTKELVKQSIEEAFMDDNAQNVGSIENHCDANIKEYYIKLAKDDEEAKAKQEKMLGEFLNDSRF
ncbi:MULTISPECIES: hypothetical protein [Helicobacter]|uniref:Uncharacterized protein n=1 Tax=Helicobacter bilis ATCC 43879 TaxID=613026 RepID=C3XGT3_9HELI|nr:MULTISPECIES: hypothetical protein [Helicobacter]EEO24222.2 hypothetical protein HRAG_01279 [Helicobacter bilis ATCC 43879]